DLVTAAASLAEGTQAGTEHLLLAFLSPGSDLAPALAQLGASVEDLSLRWDLLESHELRTSAAPAAAEAPARSPAPQAAAPATAESTAPPRAAPTGSSHTVTALARLVADLASKAALAARESGKIGVADQLDLMRSET